jgi:hypothetical protein
MIINIDNIYTLHLVYMQSLQLTSSIQGQTNWHHSQLCTRPFFIAEGVANVRGEGVLYIKQSLKTNNLYYEIRVY